MGGKAGSAMESLGEQIERAPRVNQKRKPEAGTLAPGVNGSSFLRTFFHIKRGVCLFLSHREG